MLSRFVARARAPPEARCTSVGSALGNARVRTRAAAPADRGRGRSAGAQERAAGGAAGGRPARPIQPSSGRPVAARAARARFAIAAGGRRRRRWRPGDCAARRRSPRTSRCRRARRRGRPAGTALACRRRRPHRGARRFEVLAEGGRAPASSSTPPPTTRSSRRRGRPAVAARRARARAALATAAAAARGRARGSRGGAAALPVRAAASARWPSAASIEAPLSAPRAEGLRARRAEGRRLPLGGRTSTRRILVLGRRRDGTSSCDLRCHRPIDRVAARAAVQRADAQRPGSGCTVARQGGRASRGAAACASRPRRVASARAEVPASPTITPRGQRGRGAATLSRACHRAARCGRRRSHRHLRRRGQNAAALTTNARSAGGAVSRRPPLARPSRGWEEGGAPSRRSVSSAIDASARRASHSSAYPS